MWISQPRFCLVLFITRVLTMTSFACCLLRSVSVKVRRLPSNSTFCASCTAISTMLMLMPQPYNGIFLSALLFAVLVFLSRLKTRTLFCDDKSPEVLVEGVPRPIEKKNVSKKIEKGGNKARKRNRKNNRRNNENMPDLANGTESKCDSDVRTIKKKNRTVFSTRQNANVVIVKHYAPLSIYINLALESADLYKRLSMYVLSPRELISNSYPRFSTYMPGVMVYNRGYFSNGPDHPNYKKCCRCSDSFQVSDDGHYTADTTCTFHSGKRSDYGCFSCCGSSSSRGCLTKDRHVSSNTVVHETKFFKTREKRHSNASQQVYALDCEMCYTVQGLEVTRCSVVASDGTTIYDTYVLPDNPIVDYVTEFSGVTAKHLLNVKTTLADVQAYLLKLLSANTILVGHALNNDLRALGIIHETIIDTSVTFPHSSGYPYKRSLKSIMADNMQQTIQASVGGHNSVEDARACIELMLWKVETESHLYLGYEQKVAKQQMMEQQMIEQQLLQQQLQQTYPLQFPSHQWPIGSLSMPPVLPYFGYFVAPISS